MPSGLIVNADDVGFGKNPTDYALRAFEAGGLTSGSALVFMRDSERAAKLAGQASFPLGLHFNLTLPFEAESVPEAVRARQARLATVFSSTSWQDGSSVAVADDELRTAFVDQLDEFRRCFGEPTHVDGHHHVHVHAAVLAALDVRYPLRPVLGPPVPRRTWSSERKRLRTRRFRGPRYAVAFEHVHPALGGVGFDVLEALTRHGVDVMAHPVQGQLDALISEEWVGEVARHRPSDYRAFS